MKTLAARVLLLLFFASAAHAHKASDAYLSLSSDGPSLRGQWDIALRDLELAVGIDADGDGRVTWGELRAREAAVDAYALSHLRISQGETPCPARVTAHQVDRHTDGAYAVLQLAAECPSGAQPIAVDYDLLFALDPQHRGLLRFEHGGETTSAVLSPDKARVVLFSAAPPARRTLVDFAREGVWHIWLGFDHVLFLLSLLLPAALRRGETGWEPVPRARSAVADVLRVVTAFTVAHSLTLALAALGVVALPSRLVEPLIAASVALAALDNLRPFLRAPRWAVAFGFGLVHGLGFASVLAGLGLPPHARALALIGFNAGVELGQLALVAGFLPAALVLRRSALYPRVVLAGGSLAIAGVACVWLVERGLGF